MKEQWQQIVHRSRTANKYDFGHVLVVGGSPGMVGAPMLAAEAALRIGAGLVTIASAKEVTERLEERVEEIMTCALPSKLEKQLEVIGTLIARRKVSAVVVGPGLAGSQELVRGLLRSVRVPIVVDGGGLTALQGELAELKTMAKNKDIILTPHAGEFARLTDAEPIEDLDRLETNAKEFAQQHNVTLILKGPHTIVASASGEISRNTSGNPGLATAGTGDVLAGIIGCLLAQKVEASQAARMAVYIHGVAGDIAAAEKTEAGMIASDVVDKLPSAMQLVTG